MSSYYRLKRYGDKIDFEDFEEALSEWENLSAIGKNISKNMLADCSVPHETAMKEVVKFLILNRSLLSTNLLAFEEAYGKFCHNYKIKGFEIDVIPKPEVLGRAIEKEDFISYLMDRYCKIYYEKSKAENFITRLQSGDKLSKIEKGLLLSRFGTWVTWNEENSQDDPFEFVIHGEADEVRANLGLDQMNSGNELILFKYKSWDKLKLHKPTFLDAGSFIYFDATVLGKSPFGRTRNWYKNKSTIKYKMKPRPEAIHKPIVRIEQVELHKILV